MDLTKAQLASLEKMGLSTDQIERFGMFVQDIYDQGIPIEEINKLIDKLSADQAFQKDFLTNPNIALEKVGLNARVGTNPSTGEKIDLKSVRIGTNPATD